MRSYVRDRAERRLELLDVKMRDEGLTVAEWRRLSAVPQREAEAAQLAIDDLTAEREAVESVEEVMDVTGEAMERIAALRAAVAGDVTQAEGLASCVAALRRVFDGFVLHRVESRSPAPDQRGADGQRDLRAGAEGERGSSAGHHARWFPGRQSLAVAAGAGHDTPVPPRPQ